MWSSPRRPGTSFHPRLVILLLSSLAWVGCSDQGMDTPTAPPDVEASETPVDPPIALSQQAFEAARNAQQRHGPSLMATPGVVGHGLGLVDGEPGIRVYVLAPDVPGLARRLDNVPLEPVVTGQFVAGANPQTRARPASNGFSLGHPDITAGTLGAIVQGGGGICYALSNNHVLANINKAKIGDSALQPGPYDGGQDPADAIGTLADFQVMDFGGGTNTIDAAIAEIFAPVTEFVSGATPGGDAYGPPGSAVVAAVVGDGVQKYGRTTGFTTGSITETNVTVSVCYECSGPFCFRCKTSATFEGQIGTTDMSDGGDSGSLIVTDDGTASPVGLLYAGSTTRTLANPIQAVFDRFGVGIVTDLTSCTNGGGDPPPSNESPIVTISSPSNGAAYSDGESITFQGTAYDAEDGDLSASIQWSSDVDGALGTGASISTTLSVATHTVTASVTDEGGATGEDQISVTVETVGGGGITLTATGYKVRGLQKADLEWSGATSGSVDILRDGGVVSTTANDGFFTDNIDQRGGATYIFQVCEAGTQTCSNTVTVVF